MFNPFSWIWINHQVRRQVITAKRSKADAQQAQVEADSIRIEKEAKARSARSARSGGRDSP